MQRPRIALLLLAASAVATFQATGSTSPLTPCSPAKHICEGRCPDLPPGAELPEDEERQGLCLRDSDSEVCICWLRNPAPSPDETHHQTLFKCDALVNQTMKHVMCMPPPHCFPPDVRLGCMIVLQCPCNRAGHRSRLRLAAPWHPVVAIILRSNVPVPVSAQDRPDRGNGDGTMPDKPQGDVREFSVKHLLFLLAFVIAPLLCWCLLTFFHEGKCRRKRRAPETEPLPTERVEEVAEGSVAPPTCPTLLQATPTAPKAESPPPYREAFEPGETCPLAAECGPPPSYEEAIRDQRWEAVIHRIQDV